MSKKLDYCQQKGAWSIGYWILAPERTLWEETCSSRGGSGRSKPKKTYLRSAKNHKLVIVGRVGYLVRIGEASLSVFFGAARQMAVPVSHYFSFITNFLCSIFPAKRIIVLQSPPPNPVLFWKKALCEETENKEHGENSKKIQMIFALRYDGTRKPLRVAPRKSSCFGQEHCFR